MNDVTEDSSKEETRERRKASQITQPMPLPVSIFEKGRGKLSKVKLDGIQRESSVNRALRSYPGC